MRLFNPVFCHYAFSSFSDGTAMEPIVPPAIDAYCTAHSTPPSALLQELYEHTNRNYADAQMMVGPLEAALLQTLIRVVGARRVIEIGLFTGYSALAMAEALPAGGSVLSCEVDAARVAVARAFFARSPAGGKIEVRVGPARETLRALAPGATFDFVFLDADKEGYCAYYDAVLPRMTPGALLVADNTLWSGRVLAPRKATDRALVQFNDRVRADARVDVVLLPVRDGVSLIRKK